MSMLEDDNTSRQKFNVADYYVLAVGVMQRSGVRLSVCPRRHTHRDLPVTHQGAACDAASVHFGPTMRRTDIVACCCCCVGQCDMVSSRLIAMEKTEEWAEAHGVQPLIVEVSAKNDDNVRAIFRKLFDQARRSVPVSGSTSNVNAGTPPRGSPGPGRVAGGVEDPLLKRHFSANAARMSAKRSAAQVSTGNSLTVVGSDTDDKPISRSRSLIRRMRKPKVKDSSEMATNDCIIC